MATGLSAETLSFPAFRIDVPDGWAHSVATSPDHNPAGLLTFSDPDGIGSLKIQSYNVPEVVSADRLRNMTNVDAATPLTWQHWGDYSGYQYDYLENGALYRQWWLVNGRTLMFITYQTHPESKDLDTADIDRMIRSLAIQAPRTR